MGKKVHPSPTKDRKNSAQFITSSSTPANNNNISIVTTFAASASQFLENGKQPMPAEEELNELFEKLIVKKELSFVGRAGSSTSQNIADESYE